MIPEALDYVRTQRTAVLAVEMPDGSPHASTVHFAHAGEPLAFIVLTSPHSRKVEGMKEGKSVRASFVIGTVEEDAQKTLQMDGEATISDDPSYAETYFKKLEGKRGKFDNDVFVVFTPTWWRFTDWKGPKGKTIYLSDGTATTL